MYEKTHMKPRAYFYKRKFLTLSKNKFTSFHSECPTKIDGLTVITTKSTGKCMLSWELPHWLGVKSLKKFEMKFQRKVNKYLPSLIKSLDSSFVEKCNKNLGKVISSIFFFWVFVRSEKTGRSYFPSTLFPYRTSSNTYGNRLRRQHSSTRRKTSRSHLPLTLFPYRMCSNTYGNRLRRWYSSTSRKDRQKPFSFDFVPVQNVFQYLWE